MSTEPFRPGPDLDEMIRMIRDRWPDAFVASIEGAIFFSLDEKHWPNFATIVWTDDFDEGVPSRLSRAGVYRVNIGLELPLVGEAHDRLAAQRERHRRLTESRPDRGLPPAARVHIFMQM
jgi:hypothetical protein